LDGRRLCCALAVNALFFSTQIGNNLIGRSQCVFSSLVICVEAELTLVKTSDLRLKCLELS
jgi:hypothetical protein